MNGLSDELLVRESLGEIFGGDKWCEGFDSINTDLFLLSEEHRDVIQYVYNGKTIDSFDQYPLNMGMVCGMADETVRDLPL